MTKLNGGAWSSTHKHAYRSRRSAAPLTEVAVVVNTTSSPSSTNHTGTTCGLPSLRAVATLAVRVPSITNARHSCSVIFRIACERTPLTRRVRTAAGRLEYRNRGAAVGVQADCRLGRAAA